VRSPRRVRTGSRTRAPPRGQRWPVGGGAASSSQRSEKSESEAPVISSIAFSKLCACASPERRAICWSPYSRRSRSRCSAPAGRRECRVPSQGSIDGRLRQAGVADHIPCAGRGCCATSTPQPLHHPERRENAIGFTLSPRVSGRRACRARRRARARGSGRARAHPRAGERQEDAPSHDVGHAARPASMKDSVMLVCWNSECEA